MAGKTNSEAVYARAYARYERIKGALGQATGGNDPRRARLTRLQRLSAMAVMRLAERL